MKSLSTVLKSKCVKSDWGRKSKPNFTLCNPAKYIFGGAFLQRREIRLWVSKKKAQRQNTKHKGLPTYVKRPQ